MPKKFTPQRAKKLAEFITMQLGSAHDVFGEPLEDIRTALKEVEESVKRLDYEVWELVGCLDELIDNNALAYLRLEAEEN